VKKLSEPKEKWSNAWRRWYHQQESIKAKENNGGSSQMYSYAYPYTHSRAVLAEMIAEDVHTKVFSGQPGKAELSRHIANRVAKLAYLYAEHRAWEHWDYYQKYPEYLGKGERLQAHERMGARHFEETYGDLYRRSRAALKTRYDALMARWKAENEERRKNARLREVSAVQAPDPEEQDGGGS
jgi:hypothetical protein